MADPDLRNRGDTMSDFILEDSERRAPDFLDWDDEALGLFVIGVAVMACEQSDGSLDPMQGVNKSGAVLGGLAREEFGGQETACIISLVNSQGDTETFCVSVKPSNYIEEEKKFSAVIDGERVSTDDGQEMADRIREADVVTELTITHEKDE